MDVIFLLCNIIEERCLSGAYLYTMRPLRGTSNMSPSSTVHVTTVLVVTSRTYTLVLFGC